MTKFAASILILFSVIAPAGTVSISLGRRANLTPHQVALLQTSNQICYGGSVALFALLTPKAQRSDDETKPDQD